MPSASQQPIRLPPTSRRNYHPFFYNTLCFRERIPMDAIHICMVFLEQPPPSSCASMRLGSSVTPPTQTDSQALTSLHPPPTQTDSQALTSLHPPSIQTDSQALTSLHPPPIQTDSQALTSPSPSSQTRRRSPPLHPPSIQPGAHLPVRVAHVDSLVQRDSPELPRGDVGVALVRPEDGHPVLRSLDAQLGGLRGSEGGREGEGWGGEDSELPIPGFLYSLSCFLCCHSTLKLLLDWKS